MDEEAFIKEKLASKLTLRASDKSNELLSLPSMKKKGTLAFNDKDDDLLGGADRASMLFKNQLTGLDEESMLNASNFGDDQWDEDDRLPS